MKFRYGPTKTMGGSTIPLLGGRDSTRKNVLMAWLRRGTPRLMLAAFVVLGLIFGTSLGYLALGTLRAARPPRDAMESVVAINAPNLSPGDGWEYAFYAAREYSSKEPPKVKI
jgi:hypothetical protein